MARRKVKMLDSIDGNRIVWYFGGCPWRDLKILRRKSIYFVEPVGDGIYLVKERRNNENERFRRESYEVLICLKDGRVYLEKLEPNETVFFTKDLVSLLDGADAIEMWIDGEWKRSPVPKKKKEKKEEEKVVS